MANKNSPNGLQAVGFSYSAKPATSLRPYLVRANQTNAIGYGDPVLKVSGSGGNGVNGVDLANATSHITGVVEGFYGTLAANAVGTPSLFGHKPGAYYRPATTSEDYYVFINDDPDALYSIQLGNAVMSEGDLGKNFDTVTGTLNVFGQSGVTLSATPVANNGVGQVSAIMFDTTEGNDPTQPYARVLVRLNASTETNGSAGI